MAVGEDPIVAQIKAAAPAAAEAGTTGPIQRERSISERCDSSST